MDILGPSYAHLKITKVYMYRHTQECLTSSNENLLVCKVTYSFSQILSHIYTCTWVFGYAICKRKITQVSVHTHTHLTLTCTWWLGDWRGRGRRRGGQRGRKWWRGRGTFPFVVTVLWFVRRVGQCVRWSRRQGGRDIIVSVIRLRATILSGQVGVSVHIITLCDLFITWRGEKERVNHQTWQDYYFMI